MSRQTVLLSHLIMLDIDGLQGFPFPSQINQPSNLRNLQTPERNSHCHLCQNYFQITINNGSNIKKIIIKNKNYFYESAGHQIPKSNIKVLTRSVVLTKKADMGDISAN